jgi:hypothetical protein
MIPRIFEVTEDHRLKISAECFVIPELYEIIDEYQLNAEPYLIHAYYSTAPDSIYINYPDKDKEDVIISDINQRYGEYNYDSPLLKNAISRLKEIFTTRTARYYESIGMSIDKMCEFLDNVEIEQGKEGNLSEVHRIQKEAGTTIKSYKELEKVRENEIKESMRGSGEMGYE